MSNTFKQNNNRFALLVDDIENEKKETQNKNAKKNSHSKQSHPNPQPEVQNNPSNVFKNKQEKPEYFEERYMYKRTSFFETNNEKQKRVENELIQKKNADERKSKQIKEALHLNNFPDLENNGLNNKVNNGVNNNLNYIEKVVYKVICEDIPKELTEQVKPGWVMYKKDVKSNKSICVYGEKINDESNDNEENNCMDVLNSLVTLHEKRMSEYKEMWGEEDYERTFRFPNYDYEYFDKLDDEYYEELIKIDEENVAEKEFITNTDHFNNYWKY